MLASVGVSCTVEVSAAALLPEAAKRMVGWQLSQTIIACDMSRRSLRSNLLSMFCAVGHVIQWYSVHLCSGLQRILNANDHTDYQHPVAALFQGSDFSQTLRYQMPDLEGCTGKNAGSAKQFPEPQDTAKDME